MLQRVKAYIARYGLLEYGQRHLVALSGGADSVALLLMLRQLGYSVEAVHCNFKLRGPESDRDEQFVQQLCHRLGLMLHVVHFDTRSYAELHHVSIEMAARQLRYGYFQQLRLDTGAQTVCVAHHQDDAVETLLMNLLRGTGIHGLTGIRPRNGHVVRPLLCVSRAEILSYLQASNQDYVTDSTNLVADVVRNRLRLEVLPLLHAINPAASAGIARTAQLMGEAELVFNAAVSSALDMLVVDHTISIDRLLAQPSPEYLLHELLSPMGFTPSQVKQLTACLTASEGGQVFRSAAYEVAVDRGRIIFEQRRAPLPMLRIPEPGNYSYAEDMMWRVTQTCQVAVSKQPHCATLDADKVDFPLTVRPTAVGDRFHPFGMKGTRLVSDYLTDRKFSILEKRRQLVVTDGHGSIVWLVGQRTDQRFAIDSATRRVLTLTVASDSSTVPSD